jgi:hypothetical protein
VATRTISVAGGNFNSTSTWDEGAVPVAGDAVVARAGGTSGNLTVNVASACATFVMTNYTGTLTFDSTLTLTSTCTFVTGMTVAGTAGTLICNGTGTLTSGGKTLTCGLTLGTGTFTLADSWIANGLVTTGVSTINGASGQTLTCAGGLHITASMTAGTAKLILTGGTWDQAAGNASNSMDLAGNVTVSGAVTWGASGKTLAYVSGAITTTGSTLTLSTLACTLNTAGVTWASLTFPGAVTYTLSSNLAWSGTQTVSASATFSGAGQMVGPGGVTCSNAITVTLNNTGGISTTGPLTLPNANCTFAGSAGYTVGTQTTSTLTASRTHTLTQGNTYTVTTALGNVGTTATIRQALVSSSPGTKVTFTVTPGASLTLSYCDPTDIDSSAGATVVSIGATITTSLNWLGAVVAGGTTIIIRTPARQRVAAASPPRTRAVVVAGPVTVSYQPVAIRQTRRDFRPAPGRRPGAPLPIAGPATVSYQPVPIPQTRRDFRPAPGRRPGPPLPMAGPVSFVPLVVLGRRVLHPICVPRPQARVLPVPSETVFLPLPLAPRRLFHTSHHVRRLPAPVPVSTVTVTSILVHHPRVVR